jgi:hypothetical protein
MPSEVDTLNDLAELAEHASELKSITSYRRGIRGVVAGLWRGTITKREFGAVILAVVDRGVNAAWRAGARECGIKPSDYTDAEREAINQAILDTSRPWEDFADQIIDRNRASGAKLESHMGRANLWINRYNAVRADAQQMACGDQKLVWLIGGTEEHCTDCLGYHGRVYRASTWARYGIKPQSFDLECNGWNCDCRFEVTTDPVTPGRPPRMSGSE